MSYQWIGETSPRSVGASSSWQTVTASGLPDGTKMVLLLVWNGSGSADYTFGRRAYGSSDTYVGYVPRIEARYLWAPVDSSKRFQVYTTSNTYVKYVILAAFIGGAFQPITTAHMTQPGASGWSTWDLTSLLATYPKTTGVFIDGLCDGFYSQGLRMYGDTHNLSGSGGGWGSCGLLWVDKASGDLIEVNRSSFGTHTFLITGVYYGAWGEDLSLGGSEITLGSSPYSYSATSPFELIHKSSDSGQGFRLYPSGYTWPMSYDVEQAVKLPFAGGTVVIDHEGEAEAFDHGTLSLDFARRGFAGMLGSNF